MGFSIPVNDFWMHLHLKTTHIIDAQDTPSMLIVYYSHTNQVHVVYK
jgi:hypothetical protein